MLPGPDRPSVPYRASITHKMAIGWPGRHLCAFEGQRKPTKEVSEKSQVRPQRLYLAAVSVARRLMKSDIHADLLGR